MDLTKTEALQSTHETHHGHTNADVTTMACTRMDKTRRCTTISNCASSLVPILYWYYNTCIEAQGAVYKRSLKLAEADN